MAELEQLLRAREEQIKSRRLTAEKSQIILKIEQRLRFSKTMNQEFKVFAKLDADGEVPQFNTQPSPAQE